MTKKDKCNYAFFIKSSKKNGTEQIMIRVRLAENLELETEPENTVVWNHEYYISFGSDQNRTWEDARKFGFISAGGGKWYTQTLKMLRPGDRVWVNIPHTEKKNTLGM